MKITLQILSILIFMISCKKNLDNELYSMEQIEIDSKPHSTEIVVISFPDHFFIKTDHDKIIAKPSYDDLIDLHSKFYSQLNLNSFLYSVLNLNLNVPTKYIQLLKIKTFNIDNDLKNRFYDEGIEKTISDITNINKGRKYLKRNFLNNYKDLTIEYLLYINKYLIVRDDYYALSWIEKRNELPVYIN